MNKSIRYAQYLILTGLIISASISNTKAQSKKGTSETPSVTPSKSGIKPYSEVITDKAVSKTGLFTVHKVDGKFYYEIPDSLLGREVLAVTRYVKTPAGLKGFGSYGGEQVNNQVWEWERHDKQIFIRVPSFSVKADSTSDMYQSVQNSNLPTILAAFDIKAFSKDTSGVVIDVTDFYNSDVSATGIPDGLKKLYKITTLDAARSYIDTIKTFPINTEVQTVKTYKSTESPTDNSTGAITFELNTSMILLPKVPMKARLMDARVGYFGQRQNDYGTDAQGAEVTAYIHRWRLEPKDEAAYARGELVEPKKQIVYYIDPATPKKWVPYLIEGVNDWSKAFEAAGFKNAIIAKAAPTAKEDPDFSTEDARYSVIRYFASDIANAYGPHISDPRSGEIIESHIGWFHNVMDLLHNWYLIQTAAINPNARSAKFTDEQMGELIRFVSSHEVGHTLGLPHNFGSSYAYPVDSLRSKSFTDKHGTAPSIMDYARFNYVAQPGDGVTNLYPKIGEYDLWAIKWGYSWFADKKTMQQEKEILNQWTTEHAGKPEYYYGRQGTSLDPRLQSEDLGDNAMKASTYGIENLKRILPNIEKWSFRKGDNLDEVKQLYNEVLGQFNRYMGHVSLNVGGMNENFKTYDQQGAVYDFVSKDLQHDAMLFFNKQLFTSPLWLMNNEIMGRFDNGILVNRIKNLQVNTVGSLVSSSRLARMFDNEIKNGSKAYTVAELLTDLRSGIFTTDRPDAFKRSLQRGYIDKLADLMIDAPESQSPPTPADVSASIGLTPINVALSDIRPMVRAELKNLSAIAKIRSLAGDAITKAHYDDLSVRINDILYPKK